MAGEAGRSNPRPRERNGTTISHKELFTRLLGCKKVTELEKAEKPGASSPPPGRTPAR